MVMILLLELLESFLAGQKGWGVYFLYLYQADGYLFIYFSICSLSLSKAMQITERKFFKLSTRHSYFYKYESELSPLTW